MTNTEALKAKIAENGIKITFIATKLGITRQCLSRKITNKSEFTTSEIVALCETLGITSLKERDAIFFAKKVAENETK